LPQPFAVPVTPKSIVYLRPDTIGDLVIFSSALAELQAAWPDARHTLVVRAGYETLAPLFPPSLHWHVARLNPFKQKPSACRAELAALLEEIAALSPDLIVAPTLNRTWLEAAVAAHFPKIRSVVLGAQDVDPIFAAALRLELGVAVATAFSETVPAAANTTDWENQHRLVDHLLARPRPASRPLPSVTIPAAASAQAAAFLSAHALAPAQFAAVFPVGLANVQVKSWPEKKFAEIVLWLQRDRSLPILLLGHVSEKALLETVAAETVRLGGTRPAVWLGRDGEVPVLAALLQSSRLYVGHDTGALHLAAAVGRPVVGIFGGGHWPRFRPAARQGISVVQPLPCFGCNWDCYFGDGPCVKTLAPADVRRAVEQLLATAPDAPLDTVLEVRNLPPEALALIAASAPRFADLQQDRLDRQHKIEELKRETDNKDTEITALKTAATERKTEMESIKAELEAECATKDAEIAALKSETDTKDTEIGALKTAATDRKTEMESIKAELEAECATKDTEISELKSETDTKDIEIAALKVTCNEREALIITLDGHVKKFQRTVGELNSAHGEKDRHIASLGTALSAAHADSTALRADLVSAENSRAVLAAGLARAETAHAQAQAHLDLLPPDYANWSAVVDASQIHLRNLEAIITRHDGELTALRATLAERDAVIANYVNGFAGLEQAKHYGKLLGEKEAVIQVLHRACVERAAIIAQLSAETTTVTAKLRKLWLGACGYVREEWWRPFDTWLFKKVVEDYWMQIGILRHYDPRPLVWDARIPKPRLPESRLPQIGLVTPSYGQERFIESTILSILNQNYPRLRYVVQDGGSKDRSAQIIARYASRLQHWESARDQGQADAVRKGFLHLEPTLAPDDIMAWLNSDDLIAPRVLRYVAEYFVTHPDVDVIYGHRIIIDPEDRDVGRWVMPHHDAPSIEWIDYIPQETLFWRKRAWDAAGGIDPSFQFALDWDLLARFHRAGCKIKRVPYFLGCFRVHAEQKTSQAIHTTGAEEMTRIRTRFHGEKQNDGDTINRYARSTRFRGALTARLQSLGLRW
jgi:ADP-heptose:LPS heptosyltransferase/glycosyltransferase involved in cell wall biosynthesis